MTRIVLAMLGLFTISPAHAQVSYSIAECKRAASSGLSNPHVAICFTTFSAYVAKSAPVLGDACLLERLWEEGGVISGRVFHPERPIVLYSKNRPILEDSTIDFGGFDNISQPPITIIPGYAGMILGDAINYRGPSGAIFVPDQDNNARPQDCAVPVS